MPKRSPHYEHDNGEPGRTAYTKFHAPRRQLPIPNRRTAEKWKTAHPKRFEENGRRAMYSKSPPARYPRTSNDKSSIYPRKFCVTDSSTVLSMLFREPSIIPVCLRAGHDLSNEHKSLFFRSM